MPTDEFENRMTAPASAVDFVLLVLFTAMMVFPALIALGSHLN